MLSQLSLTSLSPIGSRAAQEGPIGRRFFSFPAQKLMASVDANFAAKLSVAPAWFSRTSPHSRAKTRASLDQVPMGREITGPHAALDVVPILFPPLLVPRASLACCTPCSALPFGVSCCHCFALSQTRRELAARGAQRVPVGATVSAQ